MNKKQISQFLVDNGYADGWACRPQDVAQAGNWIFWVHPDFPDEADCLPRYRDQKGKWVIEGSFWTGVPVEKTPLGGASKATVNKTIAELDAGYRDYLIECDNEGWVHFENDPKKRFTHQLRAYAGDCASGGLSEKGDIIPFTEDNLTLVYDYLLAETNFARESHIHGLGSEQASEAVKHFFDCAHKLLKKKVFQHKWHARTQWIVEDFDIKSLEKAA